MDRLPEPAIPFTRTPNARTIGGNGAFHNFYNDYSHITDPNLRRRLALAEIDKASSFALPCYPTWKPRTDRSRSLSAGTMSGLLQWQESVSLQTRMTSLR